MLERVCATLRMTADEREYLFALVQHRPAPPAATCADGGEPDARPHARRARCARARDDGSLGRDRMEPPDEPGFSPLRASRARGSQPAPDPADEDDTYQHDPVAYETMVRRVLSKFRVDYSQTPDDPAFEALINELAERCPIFRRLWNSPEVVGRSEAIAHHPQLGGMTMEHSSYVPEGSPTLRVVIFVPYDEQSAAKIRALREEREMPRRETTDREKAELAEQRAILERVEVERVMGSLPRENESAIALAAQHDAAGRHDAAVDVLARRDAARRPRRDDRARQAAARRRPSTCVARERCRVVGRRIQAGRRGSGGAARGARSARVLRASRASRTRSSC